MSYPAPNQTFTSWQSSDSLEGLSTQISEFLASSPGWEPISVSHSVYQSGRRWKGKFGGPEEIWDFTFTALIILRRTL